MNNQTQPSIPSAQSQILVLPGVGDLLKRSWQIYKARIGTFLGIMVLPLIVNFLFPILVTILKTTSPILTALLLIILYLVVVVVNFWSQVSLLYAVKEREAKIGVKESFQRGWPKIISFFWISMLVGFIVSGGFLLFIIPGIIFAVWFSLATYVLVSEDRGGMNALFTSKQLVSGKWGSVFWRFLAMGIIAIPVIFLINFFIKILNIPFLEDIGGSIVLLFLTPFTSVFSFLVYEDLKRLKGEIPFEVPKRKTKIKFILVAIAGFLLIPVILGGIIFTSLTEARAKTRDVGREMDVKMVQINLEFYYDENNVYPLTLEDLPFLGEVPKDPKTNLPYEYKVLAGGNDYEICIDFEKKEDKCVTSGMSRAKAPEEMTLGDETADWKTYTNEEYGFEIKYPGGWESRHTEQLKHVQEMTKRIGGVIDGVEFAPQGKVYNVQTAFGITPIGISVNIKKDLNQYLKEEKFPGAKEVLINNVLATEVKGVKNYAFWHDILIERPDIDGFIRIADHIYDIERAGNISPQEAEELHKVFNQMLSTFKFLE